MKIVTITAPENGFDKRTNPNAESDFEKWRAESEEKIGYKGKRYILCGMPGIKQEFTWVGDRLFCRHDGKGHFHAEMDWSYQYPDIICLCGNDKFILKYGSYEISAKCTECGAEEVVYDG